MSNDLSVNMRRAEMDRKTDDRRSASVRLKNKLFEARKQMWTKAVTDLDEHAERYGFWREDLVALASSSMGQDFVNYFLTTSTTPKRPR